MIGEVSLYREKPDKILRQMSVQQSVSLNTSNSDGYYTDPYNQVIQKTNIEEGFDGANGWKKTLVTTGKQTTTNKIENIIGKDLERLKFDALIGSQDFNSIYQSVKFVGVYAVGSKPYYSLQVITHEGTTQKLYFDCITGFLFRVDGEKFESIFDNYKSVSGVMLPFKLYYRTPDSNDQAQWSKIEIAEWSLDQQFEGNIFSKPLD